MFKGAPEVCVAAMAPQQFAVGDHLGRLLVIDDNNAVKHPFAEQGIRAQAGIEY